MREDVECEERLRVGFEGEAERARTTRGLLAEWRNEKTTLERGGPVVMTLPAGAFELVRQSDGSGGEARGLDRPPVWRARDGDADGRAGRVSLGRDWFRNQPVGR